MRRSIFPLWADTVFYSLCAFVLSFCILRYYRVVLAVAFTAAILLAFAAGTLAYLLQSGARRKRLLSKQEQEEREKLLLHLALEKPERVRAALLEAYLADGKDAHCEGEALFVDGLSAVPLFTMEPVSADGIAHLIRRLGREFFLVCNLLTADAEALLASFSIRAERGDEVFALFSRTGTTPSPLILGDVPRRRAKQRLRIAFSKKNARPFFVSGLLLLLMSLFVLFPVYYVISGSILTVCAVTVRLFGYA